MPKIEEALEDLIEMGIVRKTPYFRNGLPVYELTELGRSIDDLDEFLDRPRHNS
jgi:DNA-binding HxlR family transcriptional regulator